jgi:hypothetical protein
LFEAVQIELVGLDVKGVSRRSSDEPVRGKRLPQVRDVGLEHVDDTSGRSFPPELVDQPVSRDDRVRPRQQEGEERPLARPTQSDRRSIAEHLKRPEDLDLDQAGVKRTSSGLLDSGCCKRLQQEEETMINSIRTRVAATIAAAAVLVGAATGAAATASYEPFVTDFPKQAAPAAYTPFVTDFGIAPRPPGGTIVVRSTRPESPVLATSRDWADVGIGAALGLGLAGVAAAATLGLRRRRRTIDPIKAARAG